MTVESEDQLIIHDLLALIQELLWSSGGVWGVPQVLQVPLCMISHSQAVILHNLRLTSCQPPVLVR